VRSKLLPVVVGITAAITALSACSSSSPGQGKTTPVQTPAPRTTSKAPSTPATTPATTPPATSSTTAAAASCPAKAHYCAQFSGSADGWPVTNQNDYFASYDSFDGGTYRLGQRSAATAVEQAPTDITNISHDYSVQIDVDATPYHSMPQSDSMGIDCWAHKSDGHESAFLFFVNPSTVEIGLWDDISGQYHKIASKSDAGLVKTDGSTNHLEAACVQGTHGGGASAELGIKINGKIALVTHYDKSDQNYAWSVGPSVGVLASGKGADVFYDNFAVTSLCHGEFC